MLLNGLDDTSTYTAALDARTGQMLWTHPDGDGAVVAGGLVYASTCRGVTILDLRTGAGLRKLNLGAGADAGGLAIANGSLYVGYNVWATDQPTLLRSAERAYALPTVPPSFLVLDDTADAVSYGPGWRVGSDADDYRGADHYIETTPRARDVQLTGTAFRYWFFTAAHHGVARGQHRRRRRNPSRPVRGRSGPTASPRGPAPDWPPAGTPSGSRPPATATRPLRRGRSRSTA